MKAVKSLLRLIGIALGAVGVLAVLALGALYALSERILDRTYPVPTATVAIPTGPEAIHEGRRLAIVHGCLNDCHGKEGEGLLIFDQPILVRIVAPNLTAATRRYTDAQLAGIIRQGVRPDGRSVLVMPSEIFAPLSDADVGRIIAFLRSVPPVAGPGPSISVGPLGRLYLLDGRVETAVARIAESVPPPPATSPEGAFGRYLARTICAGCHGSDLHGASRLTFVSPSLAVVAAYSPDAFAHLMRTGVALGGRLLPVMSPRAQRNLSSLTDEEIAALYSYLRALAGAASR